MIKNSIIQLFGYSTFLLFVLFPAHGQETLSREREREIKISGNYYYAECTAFDESVAKECALRDLTQEVIAKMLQQAIKSEKPEDMQKIVEMRANMAHLPIIGRVQILAWVHKDSIFMQNEAVEKKKPTPQPDPSPQPQLDPTPQPEPTPQPQPQPDPTPQSEPTPQPQPQPEPNPQPQPTPSDPVSDIANPIIKDLSISETFAQFTRKADGWAQRGRLVYSRRKTAFSRPENCHIAIFSSAGTLIALLNTGDASRTNMMTGEIIQNPEQHYSKDTLIWIQLN